MACRHRFDQHRSELRSGRGTAGAKLANQIGGKLGQVLGVHAVPGVADDPQTFAGFAAALKLCPGITQDTSIKCHLEIPVAKGATLGWLSSRPGAVAGEHNTGRIGWALSRPSSRPRPFRRWSLQARSKAGSPCT